MDAFAVSICKGLSTRNLKAKHALITGVWFGGFQALMPLLGYLLGISFTELVSSVDHWIAFALLGFIGFGMIKSALKKDDDLSAPSDFSFRTMLTMAIATSIDALAVGVTLAFLKVNIYFAILFIGVVTGVFSAIGVYIGNSFGTLYKSKAELAGGIILIAMGVKILLEHTIF